MSFEVFPVLDGLEYSVKRRAEFKTQVFDAVSGKESRASLRQYPKTKFLLSFEFLVEDEEDQQMVELLSFILRHLGMGKGFLFDDPVDNYVLNRFVGTGNGSRTDWQLMRNFGGFIEPVKNINRVVNPEDEADISPYIYLDGVKQTEGGDYTVSDEGLLQFVVAPGSGVDIRATFNFYYRVRFTNDGYDIDEIAQGLFESKEIEFVGSPGALI